MKTIALVIPCHNERRRFPVEAYRRALALYPGLSLCLVDDGSADATRDVLAELQRTSPAVHALFLPENVGKGETVRQGMAYLARHASAELFGFWDADLATPFSELPAFCRSFEERPDLLAAVGSRLPHLGANIVRTRRRGLAANLVRRLLRSLTHADVRDTQCGAKVFARDAARAIFEKPFKTRWLFDVELFQRMAAAGFKDRIREVPLENWRDVPGSNLNGIETGRILWELLRLTACDFWKG